MAPLSVNGDRGPGVGGRRVLVIDDCALYREALATTLASKGIPVVRTAWDLPSLIGALEATEPLAILLNLATAEFETLLRAAASLSPRVPVIAIGVSAADEDAIAVCGESAVAAYHMKAATLADLLALIDIVVQGGVSCPAEVSAMLLRRVSTIAGGRRGAATVPALTSREIQILRMLELGRSNQDIAAHLSIAVHTVKNHVHSLLTKLGVSSRAEAAALSHTLELDKKTRGRASPRSRKK